MKVERTNHPKWKYRLTEDWTVGHFPALEKLMEKRSQEYIFGTLGPDKPGSDTQVCHPWVVANKQGELIIKTGYSSDGCSCSPDFEKALPGCIAHDALRQASRVDAENCPWDREISDDFFKVVMQRNEFNGFLKSLYYGVVAGPLGNLFSVISGWFRKADPEVCSKNEC